MKEFNAIEDGFYDDFLRTVEKFIPEHYFQKHLSESKQFELFKNPQFHELMKHSPSVIGVFNNINMGFEFLSDNIESLTGHSADNYKGADGMKYTISTFRPEHAEIYNQQIFPTIFEYFQIHASKSDIKKYKFTATFQLVKKDGSVIWCMQQLNVIETDDEGLPLLTFMLLSDITNVKKDSSVDFIITKKNDSLVYDHVHAASFTIGNDQIQFTKRELEIMQLLSKGKSSNEIGDLLFISDKTVNKHRQNMLEKSGKKNTAELLTYAIEKGFV